MLSFDIEVDQHPNKYIKGVDHVSVSAVFRFPQGTNTQRLIMDMELIQKIITIKAKGFVPYLVPSKKTSHLYLDLVAKVVSENDYIKLTREAKAIIGQLKLVIMRGLQRVANDAA